MDPAIALRAPRIALEAVHRGASKGSASAEKTEVGGLFPGLAVVVQRRISRWSLGPVYLTIGSRVKVGVKVRDRAKVRVRVRAKVRGRVQWAGQGRGMKIRAG